MTQARKCSGGIAPRGATSDICGSCSQSEHLLCPHHVPKWRCVSPAEGRRRRESRCGGIVSPIWRGRERASSKHPLQTQTLPRLHSFACQQAVHKKLLGSSAARAGAAPFPWEEVAYLAPEPGLSLPPPFPPLYPLSPSAAPLPKVLISSISIACTESAVYSSSGSWWRGGTSRLGMSFFFNSEDRHFHEEKKVHF